MRDRVVDPKRDVLDEAARRAGYRTARDLDRAGTRGRRRDAPVRFRTAVTLGPWHGFNVGSTGDGDYSMNFPVPTASGTWDSTARGLIAPVAGRILGGYIISASTCTQGTATLVATVVDVDGGSSFYPLEDCEISSGTGPPDFRGRSAVALPWEDGISFEAYSLLRPLIRTAGTFAPTTADVTAFLVVAYETV